MRCSSYTQSNILWQNDVKGEPRRKWTLEQVPGAFSLTEPEIKS